MENKNLYATPNPSPPPPMSPPGEMNIIARSGLETFLSTLSYRSAIRPSMASASWYQRKVGDNSTAWTRKIIVGITHISGNTLTRPLRYSLLSPMTSPAAEGLRAGRRHPPHDAMSSLVSGGGHGTLDVQRRSLNSPLLHLLLLVLLLLLLDPPVASPPPHADVILSVPRQRQG